MRDASCRHLAAHAEHSRDLLPAIEPAQADRPADDEPEEQHERRALRGTMSRPATVNGVSGCMVGRAT
jgi:hypothetical protein